MKVGKPTRRGWPKPVKREDVMRDDLTFYVLRITPVANPANIAAEVFSLTQTTLFF